MTTANSAWSVITVTYNSARHLHRHWADQSISRNYNWIVVDNASTDGSLELAKSLGATAISSGGNVGFARANNLGLRQVTTDYVAFVNPDISIMGASWQADLAKTIESTDGLVAPQLLNSDGTEQPNARGLPFLSAKIRNRLAPHSDRGRAYTRASLDAPTYCAWTIGAAIAGKTKTVRDIGGWDEAFFLYYEDHEFGLRAWKSGHPVVIDPRVQWIHSWQRATAKLNYRAWRAEISSARIFYDKYPQFLRGSSRDARSISRVKNAGFSPMCEHLWQTVDAEDN